MENGFKYYAYFIANNNSISSYLFPFNPKRAALKWVLDRLRVEHSCDAHNVSKFFVKHDNGLSIFEGDMTGKNARVSYHVFNGIVRI